MKLFSSIRVAALALSSILTSGFAGAADIKVLTAGAFKPVVLAVAAEFERSSGHKLIIDNDTAGGTNTGTGGGDTNSRDTSGQNSNDNTGSGSTGVSRDRDRSRGDKTKDFTRDGGDRTRDFSANKTNDRSRNDTRG